SPSSLLVLIRRPPTFAIFPYTTLFRSSQASASPSHSASLTTGGRALATPRRSCSRCRAIRSGRTHAAHGPPSAANPCSSAPPKRWEEHTSELQSREKLVYRLLLDKKLR